MANEILGQALFSDEFLEVPDIEPKEEHTYLERDINSYPVIIKDEVIKRLDYLTWIEKHIKGGWTEKNITPLIGSEPKHSNTKRPNWRTVVRWWKCFEGSGRQLRSLIPKRLCSC
jgi:putative transposase